MIRYRRRPDVLERRLRRSVVLASRASAAVTLNETGALVWTHLDRWRTTDDLVEDLAPLVDAPAADIEPDVVEFVEQLRGAGFVEDDDRGRGPDR